MTESVGPAGQEPSEVATEEEPKCRCGHGRGHYMVSTEGSYTIMGYIYLLVGITAYPTRVQFRCRKCDETFGATADRELCRKYRQAT